MSEKIVINHRAVEAILKKRMRKPIEKLAHKVAANVDVGSVTDAQVLVKMFETDRAHALVVIAHPAGIAMQAKHGTLTRAASRTGLKVRRKK
jgi:hypothetical protein